MAAQQFESLDLTFQFCAQIRGGTSDAARALFGMLRSSGAEILTMAHHKILPDPERYIDAKGSVIVPLGLEHELLAREKHAWKGRRLGAGGFSYIHESRTFSLSQSGDEHKPKVLDELAQAQLAFARHLYPLLRPKYGWIDELGLNVPSDKSIVSTELMRLFWANFFGPEYVKKYGRDFLLKAPGWRKEELDDGGILYVIDESYFHWWTNPSQSPPEYFQAKVPGVKLYRSKGVALPFEIARMVVVDEDTGKESVVYQRPGMKRKKKKN